MTVYAAAPQAYKQSSIMTASPEQLVVMLYDGARRFLTQAAFAMRERQVGRAGERLQRAEAIVHELLSTLDMSQGEVAERLQAIYVFCLRLLSEARLEQDAAKVEQVIELLAELREAWAEIAAR